MKLLISLYRTDSLDKISLGNRDGLSHLGKKGREEKANGSISSRRKAKNLFKVWKKKKWERNISRNSIQKWREKGKIWGKEFPNFS
jgi:hypothetical protein